MRSNIIKKGTADEVRCAVTELRLSETFMDVPQLSVKVASSTPITFEIGDYITYGYNGVTYTLRSIPEAAKNARPSTYGGAFVYNLVFYSPMWDLRNAPFLDLVLYDNGQHFTSMPDVTTYEDVYGIAARVQANMDNMYPGKWEIRVVSGLSADSTLAKRLSETQDFSLSDGKCLDALSQVYSQWGVSFVYSYEGGKHVITIGGAETQEDTTGLFMYGRGNGLKVIKSSVQNASEIATRYYVYGGTQNMQPRYYNGRTMEPEYIHASDASNPTVTAICSGRRLLGDNMYVPNLMIPVSKWGKTKWYVWTASSHSQAVFTEVRNPSAGDDFAFDEPNIGASRNVISSVSSDSIVVGGVTYQYLTEVLYPDIRKAYIDAPQSYLDKYGIRPATLRFDGSGEREDIHPSIKGLTIGDIRAGLGSGAEYYPSASVYTDPDERVDEVLSCDNPQDDGLTSSGANKYESSSSIAVAAVEKEFELALSNRAGNKIYTLGGRGSYYVLSEGAQFQVQYDGVLNARIPIQFSLATEGRDDRIHCRAGVKVNKTTSSGVESVIGSSVDEKAVVDLSTIDMDLSVDISGVSVQSGDTISVDIELYTLTTKSHDKVTVNIEAFTARYNIAISLGTDFYIKLKQIGFDISEVPTNDGESPVISMTSGQCGGYEFEIHDVSYNASDDSWTLRCARVQDGTLGQWFPNSIFKIEPDDTFVLLNIALPEVYITANEQRLYDAALAERLYEERPLLEPEIDSKVMAESLQVLRAGMWFSVKDTDLGLAGADGSSYLILIDSVEVTDKPDTIRSFKVTLRNNKEDNVFVRMQRQIAQTSAAVQSERRSQTKTSVPEVPTKGGGGGGLDEVAMWKALGTEGSQQIDGSHITEALEDYVTLTTEQTITAKKTFADDVVLGGQKQDGSFAKVYIPSTAGAGLFHLVMDSSSAVDGETPTKAGLDEDELWSILGGSGTEQISKSHLPSDTVYSEGLAQALTPYATQEWVSGRGYLTSVKLSTISDLDAGWDSLLAAAPAAYVSRWPKFSEVTEKPDTVAGYGITDAYTKGEVNTELAKYVTLGTAQTVSGDKTHSGDVVFGAAKADGSGYGRMYVPSTAGAGLYFLVMDSSSAVDGETPTAGGGGIDEEELWAILSGNAGTEVVAKQHLPSDTVYGDGLAQTLLPYATQEWVAGSYMTTNTEQNITASKTVIGEPWAVRMSVDTSNSITGFIWKNVSGSQIAGLTYHNTARRIFINANSPDVTNIWEDTAGKYSLRVGWDELTYNSYPIMRSDNIGSYALTPSNYTSYLDSRYVNVSGDTMTGPLALPSIADSYSLKIGTLAGIQCDSTFGIVLQYESTFINVTNSGLKRNNSYTIWDSGNDGSGSGLDADTLDGVHNGNVTAAILASQGRSSAITGKPANSGIQMFEAYDNGYPCRYGNGLRFKGAASIGCGELLLGWSESNNGIEHIYYRNNRDMAETWSEWRTLAFTTDNVASATKLQTARSLWGNSFDGGQNLTGRIWAYNGINIGSLDDYGWYISGAENRIAAGAKVARNVNVGSLLVSNAWADYTKVPTNGIYSKGNILSAGNIIAYSSSSRLVKDILPKRTTFSQRLTALGSVVEFRYNGLIDRDRDIHTGLLYENVRDIMPSMCYMHEGYGALNYLDTDYINLIAGSVQEHTDEIAHLKNKVASLEMEVERLRRGLAA